MVEIDGVGQSCRSGRCILGRGGRWRGSPVPGGFGLATWGFGEWGGDACGPFRPGSGAIVVGRVRWELGGVK